MFDRFEKVLGLLFSVISREDVDDSHKVNLGAVDALEASQALLVELFLDLCVVEGVAGSARLLAVT